MKTRNLLFGIITTMLLGFTAQAAQLQSHLLVAAKMDGMQEVPAVSTTALGIASFTINPGMDSICINITVTGLSGPLSGIHIHDGAAGSTGGVLMALTPFMVGNRISTVLTGADASPEFISKLLRGDLYVNAHTAANPDGEIRGQLYLETDKSYAVMLDGFQEVPQIGTAAYGVGVFNLSKDQSKIQYNVIVQDLSGAITGAHLHFGAVGVNGPVTEDLTASVNGNVISGTISIPSGNLMDSLAMGKVYLNVHTTDNPDGEIRSQLRNSSRYIYFDAALDGAQEVPVSVSSALGAATIKLNTTMDTLWYDVAFDGLTLGGPANSAHFHNGVLGSNGPAVVELTANITDNRIKGMVTSPDLTPEFINNMLSGAIYLNVHTTLFPEGEVRGQVYRLAREGYTYSMTGDQEVPAVVSVAKGSGIASIDRDQDNVHYMFVADAITPNGIHFHNAAAGVSGPVIYALTPNFVNNGAFGYWKSSDATPFLTANSVMFRNEEVYINLHTADNSDGEIRGQVLRGLACPNIGVGIAENTTEVFEDVVLYPNPVKDQLNLSLSAKETSTMNVQILDVQGRQVYSSSMNVSVGRNQRSIDTPTLPDGIYVLRILNENGQTNVRFVKN